MFARHALCGTRWANPTQYDWLAGHWDAAPFPWPGTPQMPLEWDKPDYADALALAWESQFQRKYLHLSGTGLLDVHLSAQVTAVVPPPIPVRGMPPGLVQIHWTEPGTGPTSQHFGMIVAAMGFGEEKVYLDTAHPYRGFEF